MSLNDLIERHPEWMHSHIVNIYLVANQARKACLIDYIPEGCTVNPLLKIVGEMDLSWFMVDGSCQSDIWLVASKTTIKNSKEALSGPKQDSQVGKLLGFLGYDHNYANRYLDRMSAHIDIKLPNQTTLNIAFVMEKSKTNVKKLQKHLVKMSAPMSEVLPVSTTVSLSIEECPSITRRVAALLYKDRCYIKEHIDDYIKDLYNNVDDWQEDHWRTDLLELKDSDLLASIWMGFYKN